MTRKQGKPSLSDREAQRAVKILKELLQGPKYRGNKSALARDLGISQPAVTQLEDGTNRASLDTLKSLTNLAQKDYRDFLDPPLSSTGQRAPNYHFRDVRESARAAAIQLVCDDSPALFTREEIAQAADRALQAFGPHENPSVLRWADAIRLYLKK